MCAKFLYIAALGKTLAERHPRVECLNWSPAQPKPRPIHRPSDYPSVTEAQQRDEERSAKGRKERQCGASQLPKPLCSVEMQFRFRIYRTPEHSRVVALSTLLIRENLRS
jgi:hypothetical protein